MRRWWQISATKFGETYVCNIHRRCTLKSPNLTHQDLCKMKKVYTKHTKTISIKKWKLKIMQPCPPVPNQKPKLQTAILLGRVPFEATFWEVGNLESIAGGVLILKYSFSLLHDNMGGRLEALLLPTLKAGTMSAKMVDLKRSDIQDSWSS